MGQELRPGTLTWGILGSVRFWWRSLSVLQLVEGLVCRVQKSCPNKFCASADITGNLCVPGTVDRGACMWPLQHGSLKVVGLLTWWFRVPRVSKRPRWILQGFLWPSLGVISISLYWSKKSLRQSECKRGEEEIPLPRQTGTKHTEGRTWRQPSWRWATTGNILFLDLGAGYMGEFSL